MSGSFAIPDNLTEAIREPQKRLILVVGATDTGKTTLIEELAITLAPRVNLGIVDLDMGQSHIGPPTTIGWASVPKGFSGLSSLSEEHFYFTGTTTPTGSLLSAITGARLVVDRALRASDKAIIDTTGLVSEPAGRVLKQFKIDILRPDLVICLERSGELSHIFEPYRYQSLEIFNIRPPLGVKTKTPSERAQYRYRKFQAYLKDSESREFYLDSLGIIFMSQKTQIDNASLKNRIVSLRNKLNEDIAIGVIENVRPRTGKIYIRTKALKDEPTTLVIGRAIIDRKERTLKIGHF